MRPWWECKLFVLILTFRIRHLLPGRSNHGRNDTPDVIYSREFITLPELHNHGEKIVDIPDLIYYNHPILNTEIENEV